MKIKVHAVSMICCATLAALPIEPSAPVFENDQVKVIRALEKAHVKGKFHDHKVNRVMIYLQSARQRFEYQDGRKPEVFDWKAGEVKWSPADGMHSPEADEAFNIVEVELKTPATGKAITSSLDPVAVDPKHYKVEFENEQVRVLRVKVEAHGKTPMHEHSLNRVGVYLTDQDFRTKDSTGKAGVAKHKAGDVAWSAPITHEEQNLSDKPFEIVVVEIKS